ncbi:DUF6932 family protein [Curtobacterium sp. TC1]|uniref:DUF6932 family protein n=1 Tax=Curtobacterium sp. TC1 TaxID=2862880 RepID=UPI003965D0E5
MPIPSTSGPYGLLPPGKHPCSMDEIQQVFVLGAPFSSERQVIFDAFSVWMDSVRSLFPGARCWVDGGFVTHKSWAAPTDIDVAFFVRQSDLDALDPSQQAIFESLQTDKNAAGVRVQPMGGKVDGFVGLRSDPDTTLYWRQFWGQVKGPDGAQVQNTEKGFLEVIA